MTRRKGGGDDKRGGAIFLLMRFLSRVFCKAYFRARFVGIENVPESGGVILASNHQSFADPPLVGIEIKRPTHFMARNTLFDAWRPFGWLLRKINAFPVEKDRGDIAAVRETMRRLREGAAVVVFPEGTRTHDGEIGELKPGVFVIAGRAGVPVVPVLIEGAFEAWPRTRLLPRPRRIVVSYAEPLRGEDYGGDAEAMAAACRERMLALRAEARALRSGAGEQAGGEALG